MWWAFLDRGGVLVWGLVPTNFEPFGAGSIQTWMDQLDWIWAELAKSGVDRDQLLARSLLSPATCCLVNPDGERTVERAFEKVSQVSTRLRERFGLSA